MKILMVILLVSLSACDFKGPPKRNYEAIGEASGNYFRRWDYKAAGMSYMTISLGSNAIFVINLTKDSLEVEILKRSLK